MVLQLYYNSSPNYYIDKTLTPIGSGRTVTPYNAVNINHPSFILENMAYSPRINYCRVTFDNGDVKYYFCTVQLNNGGQNILSCDIDPLKTNAAGIRGCSATILRYSNKQGRTGATIFPDDKYPVIPNRKEIKSTILENNFFTRTASECYLLSVIGDD